MLYSNSIGHQVIAEARVESQGLYMYNEVYALFYAPFLDLTQDFCSIT
jgi:hypothetical protein